MINVLPMAPMTGETNVDEGMPPAAFDSQAIEQYKETLMAGDLPAIAAFKDLAGWISHVSG